MKVDTRETDYQNKIFCGFYPIHYAVAFNNFEALRKLAPLSFTVKTKQPVYTKSNWLNNDQVFQLSKGQDILNLAIAQGNISMCKEILNYHVDNELIGNSDQDGYTHLMLLSLMNMNNDTHYLMSDTKILNEISLQANGRTVLTLIAKQGDINKFQWYLYQISRYQQLIPVFYQQLLQVCNHQTIEKFVLESAQNAEIKNIFISTIQLLIPQAIASMKKNIYRYKQQLAEFEINYTNQIQNYEKEYTINEVLEIIQKQLIKLQQQKKQESVVAVKQQQPIKTQEQVEQIQEQQNDKQSDNNIQNNNQIEQPEEVQEEK